MSIPEELVERMATLLSRMVKWNRSFGLACDATEARAIVALLPKPVDPDLIEAREIAASHSTKGSFISISAGELTAEHIRAGIRDDDVFVRAIATAIKRGRELAQVQS